MTIMDPITTAGARSLAERRALTCLDTALELASKGYALLPVVLTLGADGKKSQTFVNIPGTRQRVAASTDADVIRDWWVQDQSRSFAIDVYASGIEVVDLDLKGGQPIGEQGWGDLPRGAMQVRTQSGGAQLYFRRRGETPELGNSAGRLPGVDTRGAVNDIVYAPGAWLTNAPERTYITMGAIVAAGHLSPLPDVVVEAVGKPVKATVEIVEPSPQAAEDMPVYAGLEPREAQRIQGYVTRVLDAERARCHNAAPGEGNSALFQAACNLIELAVAPWNDYTLEQAHSDLLTATRARTAALGGSGHGQTDEDFEKSWGSAYGRSAGKPRGYPRDTSVDLSFDPFRDATASVPDPYALALPEADDMSTLAPPVQRLDNVVPIRPSAAPVDDGPKMTILPTLPAEFYQRRPWLTELRQIAHERTVAPDSVLGSYLAIVASQMPAGLHLHTGIKSPITASLYVILAGPSGYGKTQGVAVAESIYNGDVDPLPLSTGAGLVESFYGKVQVQDPETLKFTPERGRTSANQLFVLDEGRALLQMERKPGNDTGDILRTAWSGGHAGQNNATEERRRRIKARTYNLGLIMGMQNEVAGELLADTSLGTPQRFLYFGTLDPDMPLIRSTRPFDDVIAHRVHPDYVQLAAPEFIGGSTPDLMITPMVMTLVETLRERLHFESWLKGTGQAIVDEQDSQRPVSVGKLAMVLAYLDGENQVTEEVWEMATQIYDTSCEVRDALTDLAHQAARETRRHLAHEEAEHRYYASAPSHSMRIHEMQQQILAKIDAAGGEAKQRDITQGYKSARRDEVLDAIDHLVTCGQVTKEAAGRGSYLLRRRVLQATS